MKKVKLFLYNYGNITQIADFKNAGHDAFICLRAMNVNQMQGTEGKLSEDVFYFLQWTGKHDTHISVEYTNVLIGCPKQELKIRTHLFNNSLQLN